VKFRCERDVLADAVATAQRAVASRTGAPPILSDLRVSASAEGTLELVGSDLEITNRVVVPADVEEAGVAVVPKIFGDVVKRLRENQPVSVTIEGEEATITDGRSRTELRLKAADDYPRLTANDEGGVRVSAEEFAGALRQVVPAASRDDLRPILTGVLLAAHGDGLRLVATDSYRLAVRDLKGVNPLAEGQRVLVAAKGLAEVQRVAGPGEIEIVLGEREVTFRTSKAQVTARRIEGEFPNYEQLIPSSYPNRLVVDTQEIVEAVQRVMIVGQGRDNAAVRLSMHSGGIDLSVNAQEIGSSEESIDAKYDGSDMTVAFNPSFLLDGINAVGGEQVALETVDPLKPATLRPADGGDYLYLLMPVRTS
jgi:DNA polymerase-3 subunit beta